MKRLELLGVEGIGEIHAGASLGQRICKACLDQGIELFDDDVLVVAQKIVSKAEGRTVCLDDVQVSARAQHLGCELDKEAALVEVILGESRKVIRTGGRALIVETHHGFVCANAGVDASNAPEGTVILLPEDPDRSACSLHACLEDALGFPLGVIISDTFGRPWRQGLTNVALSPGGVRLVSSVGSLGLPPQLSQPNWPGWVT